ncbi:Serine--tRNA ligase [Durusdinium trenchii]|uniref:serine--tRNA ligase n=1 Tax=Durusdinium trenchii TaxID=1381693 RepID=A0ABP0I205_9DINO
MALEAFAASRPAGAPFAPRPERGAAQRWSGPGPARATGAEFRVALVPVALALAGLHASRRGETSPRRRSRPRSAKKKDDAGELVRPTFDFAYWAEHVEEVQKNADNRQFNCDVAEVVAVYQEHRSSAFELQQLAKKRNEHAKSMKGKMEPDARQALIEEGKKIKEEISSMEAKVDALSTKMNSLALAVPNLTHPDTPIGEEENATVLRTHGTPLSSENAGFKLRDHLELGGANLHALLEIPAASPLALILLALDLVLTSLIVWKVPFTNVDWEAYMTEVEFVLRGEFDYQQISGPTGPIAYPAGFCWLYGSFRWLALELSQVQTIFAGLYLATMLVLLKIYRHAKAPLWVFGSLRCHSIFVLRLFNDAAAQFFCYFALLLLLEGCHRSSSLIYSLSVSVKMQPLLVCPVVGLYLVLHGWKKALSCIATMLVLQLFLALPFLQANPWAYLRLAFGGPGDLQHAWSVNWRFLPEVLFTSRAFVLPLLLLHILLLLYFAHFRWIPGGFLGRSIRRWHVEPVARAGALEPKQLVAMWFTCNFIGIACLRTMHFQFLVWYFHTVPFLAWFALGATSLQRCLGVVALTGLVELSFLITTHGQVRGPDGRSWNTKGVPSWQGSLILQAWVQQRVKEQSQQREMLDLFDFESGGKVSGQKFLYFKNGAALLELALIQWATHQAVKRGFQPFIPPDLVRAPVVAGCGFAPRDDEATQIYEVSDSDLCLAGTAEIPMAGMFLNETLIASKELPKRLVAFSHAFRTEAGSSGSENRGIYRLHQFSKVELFAVTRSEVEESNKMLEEIRALEEELFTELGLCFRVLDMPTEELGAPAYRKYDMEAWMPGLEKWGEISSCSSCTDFQARRLNIRHKEEYNQKGNLQFAHTLNGTACAVPRMIISILETFQNEDGSVSIPEVLQPYMMGMKVLEPKAH